MSLVTPTTQEINDNIISQLESQLNQTIPLLPKSFLRVLAKVLSAVYITLYKYCGFMFLQIFVASASNKETIVNGRVIKALQLWGDLIGVGLPVPAINAELMVSVTVENQTGTLPAYSQLVSSSNGVTYVTLSPVLLNSATVNVQVKAVSDQANGGGAGDIGNLDPGAVLTFANPLPNIAREATVVSQVITGADEESTEDYRQRIITRFQQRPQGGALLDYKSWAEEVEGIIRAFPYTSTSPGQVDVYCEATEESSGNSDGFPTQAQLDQVLASIELDEDGLATRRPANAFVNVQSITRIVFDVEISGLAVDNPASVQADIEDAIEEYFLSREPFIVGVTINKLDYITNSAIGGIVSEIVNAANGIFLDTKMKKDTELTPVYTLGQGEKAKVANVTFIS